MDIPPNENKCRNCGRPIPNGALFCGMCGTRPQGSKASSTPTFVPILLFCVCGLPCGGFGACTAVMMSGQPYQNQDGTFLALGVLGLLIFVATLVYMVKSLVKK